MYNRLLVELVLHETWLLTILMIPQYLMMLSSLSCHPLKFILIVTISDDSEDVYTSLVFRAWFSQLVFCGNTMYSGIDCRINTRILNLEHTVNVTAVFTCLESNDNDPVNGVLSSSVGVNHMLEKYLFRKTDLEYAMTDLEHAVTDLEYSVDAHPFETNMKLQD